MIEVLFGAVWMGLGVYIVWYFFKAETLHRLSGQDLTSTWQLHKKQTGCRASTIDTIHVKNERIVGFTCNCGYNYMHKRSITQRTNSDSQPKINDLIKSDKTMQKMGLTNAQINKL